MANPGKTDGACHPPGVMSGDSGKTDGACICLDHSFSDAPVLPDLPILIPMHFARIGRPFVADPAAFPTARHAL